MKTYLKTALRAALIVSGAIFIQSCSDDDEAEVKQLYYLSSEPAATLKPSQFELSLLDNTLGGERTGYYVVGKSTMRADKNVKLRVEQDNSLVESYNAEHKTSHEAVPEGTFAFSTRELTIKAGDNFSSDTLYVSVSDLSKLEASKTYVLPITLKSSDDGAVSVNRSTVCFVLSKKEFRISTKKPASWEAIDRSAWKATASYTYETNSAEKAIDDKNYTYWFAWTGERCWWAAEWETPVTAIGISVIPRTYYGVEYNLKRFSVSYKKTGTDAWQTLEGDIVLNSSTAWQPQYAAFSSVLEGITGIRINVLEPGNDDYIGMSELNLFGKK